MNTKLKLLFCAASLACAFSVQAYQADITVNASIDPTVGMTLSDGTAMPTSVDMSYTPGVGLSGYKTAVKLWSNAALDINVYLANEPKLADANGDNPIPLSVSLNNTALTTTSSTLKYSTLFPNGLTNGSIELPLAIKQTTPTATVVAGKYSGLVSIVLSQATTKDGTTPAT
ncbi:fimbrial protein [Phytobacter diazotrophicus]|uniref:CS1 type fimbrial major subunit n=1 Tax=Enterobacteriaceae TaxID=543 RepID=UPI001C9A16C4|nr:MULTISPECIES: CS1 type fimbrial major subunit [Enterobacteriaceae]MBY6257786.1 fimbrial protein [Phytobacter diazotrophicus]